MKKIKKEAREIIAVLMVFVMSICMLPKYGVRAADTGYTELKFGDWAVREGSIDLGDNIVDLYSLTDSSKIDSMDGVAISGKVNFKGQARKWMTIGGTDDVKQGGFWLGAVQENGWTMACQGIGTGYNDEIRWSEAAKFNQEVELRITFNKAANTNNWTVKVYGDGVEVGSWTYTDVNPGLYIGIPQSMEVDMTPSSTPAPTYKELKFSDWSEYLGESSDTGCLLDLYGLPSDSNITSLDGVAITGKFNFNGQVRNWLTIGGTADTKYAGFWLGAVQENGWAMACQGIGTGYGEEIRWSEAAKFNSEVELRITFDKVKDTNTWTVNVYADGTLVGTWSYADIAPGLYIGVPQSMSSDMVKPDTTPEYREMKFSDWSVSEGSSIESGSAMNVYRLPDDNDLTSLDGVAITGKINFNGQVRKWLSIGGTADIKYAGFWLGAVQENGWAMTCQGVGTDYGEEIRWNEAAKFTSEVELRMTFDKAKESNVWTVNVYADGTLVGTWTYDSVTPGLYLGIAKEVSLDMPSPLPEPEYKEMKFSDWSVDAGTVNDFAVLQLSKENQIESLDGVVVSGKINFNGNSRRWIAVGGNETSKNGGFWLGAIQENGWTIIPQEIGGEYNENYMWNEKAKFESTVTLRLTFDQDKQDKSWKVGVYIDGVMVGQHTYKGVNPGTYISVQSGVSVEGIDSSIPDPVGPTFSKKYTELKFTDFGMYNGEVEKMDIYSLKGRDDIESLDKVAISGTVNFKNTGMGKITVGGTDQLKQAGFWLFNDAGCLRLSPQGIGVDGIDHHVLWEDAWTPLKDQNIHLRMTFNKEVKTKVWWVGIYINGEQIGMFDCGVVTPGLYCGVDPKMFVEGLGDVVKKSGLDFTLFGYSNRGWRKEMGLK